MAKLYVAEVRNIKDDPTQSGRVRVRIYGHNQDQQNIKDEDLPWALPLQPISSAATNNVGLIPTGLKVGSRVVITYLENDVSEQYPIILGSFARAIKPEGV
jgi:hypothetical protein